jgi:membrane associated rhomboid family serine protease
MAQEGARDQILLSKTTYHYKITQAHREKTIALIMFTMLPQDTILQQGRRYI